MTDSHKDFQTQWARHIAALTQANARNKQGLFDALAVAQISAVTVTFDGESDNGQINDVIAYAGGAPADLPKTPLAMEHVYCGSDEAHAVHAETLHEAIEDLCYAYLSQQHGGWENNDGAYGEFTINVEERSIALEFNGRFTDVNTSTHSF